MDEASKTLATWGDWEKSLLTGSGIDIGCGPDPITPDVRPFDVDDGDANCITQYVDEQFDYVFSSHCLEHMHDPYAALKEWWQLVKPGGHLIFLVPDEDLYEQGVFPSRFNADHKATFTISKVESWSPVSVNVRDLAHSLEGGEVLKLAVNATGYDRSLRKHGDPKPWWLPGLLLRPYRSLRKRRRLRSKVLDAFVTIDQTTRIGALAQIECIVRKRAGEAAGT
jgi:SAM-dependent methyltransferase